MKFTFKIITLEITCSHTVTLLNYLATVPSGSDFLRITMFPEVYHGQGISKAVFSAPEDRVTGQGRDTTSSVMVSWEHRYILCFFGTERRGRKRRSETSFFRISEVEKRNYCSMDTKNE